MKTRLALLLSTALFVPAAFMPAAAPAADPSDGSNAGDCTYTGDCQGDCTYMDNGDCTYEGDGSGDKPKKHHRKHKHHRHHKAKRHSAAKTRR